MKPGAGRAKLRPAGGTECRPIPSRVRPSVVQVLRARLFVSTPRFSDACGRPSVKLLRSWPPDFDKPAGHYSEHRPSRDGPHMHTRDAPGRMLPSMMRASAAHRHCKTRHEPTTRPGLDDSCAEVRPAPGPGCDNNDDPSHHIVVQNARARGVRLTAWRHVLCNRLPTAARP